MNNCGWVLFILVIVDAGIRLAYAAEGLDNVIKPTTSGVVLAIGMCVLTWFAVHP